MKKIILDTNVPVKAAIAPNNCPDEEKNIQKKCMEYIRNLTITDSKLVLDMDYEILKEYENNIDKNTNLGKVFFRWLYSYLGKIHVDDFLKLEKNDKGDYLSFPYDDDTRDFDVNDRKFVALANLHLEKPPIIEATDGKWIGYVDAFAKYGIQIDFLDYEYAQRMYQKKILSRRNADT